LRDLRRYRDLLFAGIPLQPTRKASISFSIQLEIKQTRITASDAAAVFCAYRQNDSRSGKILCERSKSGELSARHVHSVTGQRSNQLNYVPTRQINEMRNRQCLCGFARFAYVAQIAQDDPK
jgi:hypothetical protein